MYVMKRCSAARGARGLALAALAACAAALIAPATGQASTTLSTFSAWNGSAYINQFGDPDTATYGQTVTAPSGTNRLSSFTFYVELPTGLVFRPYVYAWSGTQATGPALYEGPETHTTEARVFQPVTINTGGVLVTPGQKYVLFFSISNDKAIDEGTNLGGDWGYIFGGGGYSEGSFVYINNSYKPEQWTDNSWEERTGSSLAFTAVFGDLPSVSSVSPSTLSSGTQVTVSGANFTGATEVLFGGVPATSFTVVSDGQITAVAPGGPSGTVDVQVVTPYGSSATGATDQVTFTTPSTPASTFATKSASTPASPKCVVPFMRALTEQAVERALLAANCKIGKVAYHYDKLPKGELFEQSLHQTTVMPVDTTVSIWLSLGAHRHKHHKRKSR
jgi:hypothetical protein